MKEETQIGYKIVKSCGKSLRSYLYYRQHSLRYRTDCFTKRKKNNGPLALFASVEDALNYINYDCIQWESERYHIYQCEYTPSKDSGLWNSFYGDSQYPLIPNKATVYADKIKLLKRVR